MWLGLITLNSYYPSHQEPCPFQVDCSAIVQKWRWCARMYFNCSVLLSACLFITALASACLSLRLSHSLPAWLSVYLTVCLPYSAVCLTVCLPDSAVCLTVCLPDCPGLSVTLCLPDYRSISQFACRTQRSVSQFACRTQRSVSQFACLTVWVCQSQFACLTPSQYLTVCLPDSVCLSQSLPAWLSVYLTDTVCLPDIGLSQSPGRDTTLQAWCSISGLTVCLHDSVISQFAWHVVRDWSVSAELSCLLTDSVCLTIFLCQTIGLSHSRNQHTRELINARNNVVIQVQQQRPKLPTVTLTWRHACKYKVHKLHYRYMYAQSSGAVWKSRWPSWAPVPNKPTVSVDVKQHPNKQNMYVSSDDLLRMYLWWSLCTLWSVTRMPDESYRRRLRSLLLYLCYVFRTLELTPLCVDSARALWASSCFRFLVCLSHSLQAWLSVYRSLSDYRPVSVCLPYYQCTHGLNIYVQGCKRLEIDLLRKVAVNPVRRIDWLSLCSLISSQTC